MKTGDREGVCVIAISTAPLLAKRYCSGTAPS